MGKLPNKELLSDGLQHTISKSKKLSKLTEYTYQQIVKMFENPSNIKPAEEALLKVLKAEKEEESRARGREFNKPVKVTKTVKMPNTNRKAA